MKLVIYDNKCNTQNGKITDVAKVTEMVNRMSGSNYSNGQVLKMIDEATDCTYISRSGEECDKVSAFHKFIRLPVTDNFGQYIRVDLYKRFDNFEGFFVGTYSSLLSKITDDASERVDSGTFGQTINDLYDRLLDKEYWKDSNGRLGRLISYLYATYRRCKCVKDETNNVLTTSDDGSKYCFNTKLLDVYGNFIYVACSEQFGFSEHLRMTDIEIIVSKSDYVQAGFSGERPSAVSFFTDIQDVVFQGTLENFDLEDTRRLNHLVEDNRKVRLPQAYQAITAVDMAMCVKYSIETALKMLITDYRYIVPMYNVRLNLIQFMIPLYLKKTYSETPEVVLIIGKEPSTGLYVINTMLDIESAYTNSRTISASTASWLERAMALKQSEKDNDSLSEGIEK